MNKIAPSLALQCRNLRRKGFTLREISKLTSIPFTTIYGYVADIPISLKLKEKIKLKQIENTNRLIKFNIEIRKGKCISGRIVPKPKGWSCDLIYLIAHFMFDGEMNGHSCVYNNRNEVLINRVRTLMKKIFNLEPRVYLNEETGVHRISYHYVELAIYIQLRVKKLLRYIQKASQKEKKIFLQAFFDDEGSIHSDKKIVRGYQHNLEILKLVQKLLKNFNIESKIDNKYQEIIVSRKPNIIKFRDKINFSKGIYINPDRKNSVWKQKLEKRQILQKVIHSYTL
jgi:hypothetical protein